MEQTPPPIPPRVGSPGSGRSGGKRSFKRRDTDFEECCIKHNSDDEDRFDYEKLDEDADVDGYLSPEDVSQLVPKDVSQMVQGLKALQTDDDLPRCRPLPVMPARSEQSVRYKESQSHIDKLQEISKYPWYWGPLSLEETNELMAKEPQGTFIVQDSNEKAQSILCMTCKNLKGGFIRFGIHKMVLNQMSYFSSTPAYTPGTKMSMDRFVCILDLIAACDERGLLGRPLLRQERLYNKACIENPDAHLQSEMLNLYQMTWYWGPVSRITVARGLHGEEPGAAILCDCTDHKGQVLVAYVLGKRDVVFPLNILFDNGYFKVDYLFFLESRNKWSKYIRDLVTKKFATVVTPTGDIVSLKLLPRRF